MSVSMNKNHRLIFTEAYFVGPDMKAYKVEVWVDPVDLSRWMGEKAVRNKTKKSGECSGAVVVKAFEIVGER